MCIGRRGGRASSDEELDSGAESAAKAAQRATGNATSMESAQPTRCKVNEEGAEEAAGAGEKEAQETAREYQSIAGCGGAAGPGESGIVKAPNAD